MKVREIFRRPIARRIEEVIKVDLAEAEIVADEIDEYVVTDHIAEEFEGVLEHYAETIRNPDEATNVWVSGFFGSGKSSFAKVLGYLLADPVVEGTRASERFLARVASRRIEALLNTIHAQAPTHTVFVDLSTGKDVLNEGESIVLPLYRALLGSLGYSRNILLAELEYDLESDGQLEEFIETFAGLPEARGSWEERRNVGLARAEASHAMHLLRPKTYPHADSWSKSAQQPNIDANWFAGRSAELLRRRGQDKARLIFVVDEVGQYVARSVGRMLDLQGLAEAVQKRRGELWLVVTSQETLNDVVDSLEGRQVELARVQDRFPLRVDLLPADIDEVVAKRVLDKSDPGQRAVREVLRPHRNRLASHVRLVSPTRASDVAEEDLVRLYPMVPYQVQVLIDAVNARRRRGSVGVAPMLGGSNRTLIKLAQQLVVDPGAGLGDHDVGALVTMDRAYDLLESIIPTAWQAEVRQLAERYGDDAIEVAVTKAIALCSDVPALPLDAENLAVLLHPSIDAEGRSGDVTSALENLVRDEVVRRGDEGYRLQSPQEKDWERTRRGIEPRPADRTRLRRQLLRDALGGLSVTARRTFKVALSVEGEKVADGQVPLLIEEAGDSRRGELRTFSREGDAQGTIWWAYREPSDTTDALDELFRSRQMLERREGTARDPSEIELLGEERNRLGRLERDAVAKLERDLRAGEVIFQGVAEEAPTSGALRATAEEIVRSRVPSIYPRLDEFSAPVTRKDVLALLQADDLRGLPDYLADGGLGIVRTTPDGVELATDRDPLSTFVEEIKQRASYGNEATGAYLEQRFGAPPYGASIEVVQALAAAAIRAGLIEAIHQGAHIGRADDPRLERVLGTIPAFRSASFAPQLDEVDLPTRAKVAQSLAELTGDRHSPVVEVLAPALRSTLAPDREASRRVSATLRALALPVPSALERAEELVDRLLGETDKEAVRTAAQNWADLMAGRSTVEKLDRLVSEELNSLRRAVAEAQAGVDGLGVEARSDLEALNDLLRSGSLADHFAEIKSTAAKLAAERQRAREEVVEELRSSVSEQRERLRASYSGAEDDQLALALGQLENLVPEDGADLSIDALRSRVDAVPARAERARQVLDELLETAEVVPVSIGSIAPEPIETDEQLEVVLRRLREAVQQELGAGRTVRLR
jgi:hypothetical protein